MLKLIVRGVAASIPLLIGVSMIIFLIVPLIPGDPAIALAGENASRPQIERVREGLGLDDPLPKRYADWASGAVRGDLGSSLYSSRRVSDEVFRRLPVTMSLVALALLFGGIVGIIGGTIAGTNPRGVIDRTTIIGASLGVAVPNFWLGMLLVLLLAINFNVFPATGYTPLAEDPAGWLKHLTLPAIALGTAPAAELARQVRGGLIDSADKDFIRTAIAKGLRRRTVIGKHAMKHIGVVISTVFGIQVSVLIGASVVVEQVFGLPGIGTLAVNSVLTRDLPMLQGIVLVTATIVLLSNLAVDLLYGYFNPKIRMDA